MVAGHRSKASRHLFVDGGSHLQFVKHRASVKRNETRCACTETLRSWSGLKMGWSRRHLQGTRPAFCPESLCSPHHPRKGILGPGTGGWTGPACTITVSPETSDERLTSHTARLPNCGKAAHPKHLWGQREGPARKPGVLCGGTSVCSHHPRPARCPGIQELKGEQKSSPVAVGMHTHTLMCTQPTLSPTLTHTHPTHPYPAEAPDY